jgi:predicted short-subunit dehydrogenase-like oxidoreductase (DUF2520 family)
VFCFPIYFNHLAAMRSVMLPHMKGRPSIAIVGPGNLGSTLAVSLGRAGYRVNSIVAKRASKSVDRARKLARDVGASLLFDPVDVRADIVWFCVPDSHIASAASWFAKTLRQKEKVALHSSGALTSDELNILRRNGVSVASVHPLMTFVPGSRSPLAGVAFAIEGDTKAVRIAKRIVRDLAGHPYAIRKQDKAAYHAWGAFTSPLVTALLATSEEVAKLAGVPRKEARVRAIPILLQTLANYASFGAPGAFSGPVIRGDVGTVKRHLRALRKIPVALDVYVALARAGLELLPSRNQHALGGVLRLRK